MSFVAISVPVAGITNRIQSAILSVIYLDVLQTNDWLVPFLIERNIDDEGVAPADSSFNSFFDNTGFSSTRMLINLGSTLVYLILIFFALVVHVILRLIAFLWPE